MARSTDLSRAAVAGVNVQAGTAYALLAADHGDLVVATNAAIKTFTLPGATERFANWRVTLFNKGPGAMTVARNGETINAVAADVALAEGQSAEVGWDGAGFHLAKRVSQPSGALAALEFVIDGGGAPLSTGVKGFVEVPFDCTIVRGTLLADVSGSVVVDIFKSSYAAFDPPTTPASGNKITGSAPLTISAAKKAQDTTLTGWSTALLAGDILAFNVNSAATVTRVTVALLAQRT
jgi:hypothetical protein